MQFREFGKTGWKVSALGFGCMRLPTTDGNMMSGSIDEKEAIRMIRFAIDHGVNYVDTAYGYHEGQGEIVVGKALRDGYREKVKLATKSPVWKIQRPEDFDTLLEEQLKRLQTNHIDFYLFHALDSQRWNDIVLKLKLMERVEGAIRNGKILNIGFSFHDNFGAFKEIIDGYGGWNFCQIQYNYIDTENQAGTRGLKYAASKGLAVVVMEPLRGGKLSSPPKDVQEIFDNFGKKRSPSDWGLQWLWNQPEVSVVLSGMSSIKQVEENVHSAEVSGVNSLGAEELQLIEAVRTKFGERKSIPCTQCGYCMPCPNGVNIPRNFELLNSGIMLNDMDRSRMIYSKIFSEKEHADKCVKCGACEKKCPQKIPISELMTRVHGTLGEGKPF
jgi:predicted aldo/keto reductase-like oxidoreductase